MNHWIFFRTPEALFNVLVATSALRHLFELQDLSHLRRCTDKHIKWLEDQQTFRCMDLWQFNHLP